MKIANNLYIVVLSLSTLQLYPINFSRIKSTIAPLITYLARSGKVVPKVIFNGIHRHPYISTISTIGVLLTIPKTRNLIGRGTKAIAISLFRTLGFKNEADHWEYPNTTSLHDAVTRGNVEAARKLIANYVDINVQTRHQEETALHVAARDGNLEIVRALLAAHAHVDPFDVYGQTPLWLAAVSGHLEIVRTLIAAHATVNVRSSRTRHLILYDAYANGHREIVRELLASGADIDDHSGVTALHMASANNQLDMIQEFLDAHINPNILDQTGQTALHTAARNGHLNIARALIEAGVDKTIRDRLGRTARDVAGTHQAIIDYFDTLEHHELED